MARKGHAPLPPSARPRRLPSHGAPSPAHVVVARDLYPHRLPGDEPEELEVVPWKLDALHALALREDCSEGRSLAALFITREWLRNGNAG